MQSIMQEEKKCYLTGSTSTLDKHHIFGGALRNESEKYGLWVWLNHDVHMALHQKNYGWELTLKQEAQKRFEFIHSRELFMEVFKKNYL